MGTHNTQDDGGDISIPTSTLATLRGILVSSLSRENLGPDDARRRKVTFRDGDLVLAGAAPVDANQRQSARSSAAKDGRNRLVPGDGGGQAADPPLDDSGSQKDREDRVRALKERQNEERQKKLEELKQQALAAQKFREQKEEERRRRMEELRARDNDRRLQVEERKRMIWEAERDRREAILRKNQEREARIDSKRKNERSSIVFAFGSSTPRMLEPADTGGSFWGPRRATSTTNVMMFTAAPLTRRASERELDGSKKRATSAGGLDRKPGEGEEIDSPTSGSSAFSSSVRVNRRKTDLMPTIPSPRDLTPTSAGSRPPSAYVQNRPFSRSPGIAGEVREGAKPPLPKVHSAKKQPPSKPETPAKKPTDKILKSAKASPRVTPKATPLQSPGSEAAPMLLQELESKAPAEETQPAPEPAPEIKPEPVQPPAVETVQEPVESKEVKIKEEPLDIEVKEAKVKEEESSPAPASAPVEQKEESQNILDQTDQEVDMTASMTAKIRITTEEEAKAALAERRRLAREQAEREAEMERLRQEEEQRREEERLRQEEEEQRRFEEEQLRLVEEARRAEEERLLMAIKENEKREEEERKRREEEARLKAEKEEAEKKAREEAEKQRREMEIRLKKEEEERIARRKRVEAIMLRTRGKGATPTGTPTKSQGEGDSGDGDVDEGKDESPSEEHKPAPGNGREQELAIAADDQQEQEQLQGETTTTQENGQHPGKESPPRLNNSELLLIDNSNVVKPMEISEDLTISSATNGSVQQSNGHRNGMDFVNVDNVKQLNNTSNNLLDLSEFDAFSTNNQNNQPVTETTGGFEQILDLANENVTSNGPTTQPFIAFQDNLGKKQDTSVTDLLS